MRPNLHIRERITALTNKEQKLLAAGEKPQPHIKNHLQRTAVRLLFGFLALMLVFTIVSRVASGVTVASAQVDILKSGVLTNRATIEGVIEAEGDISLSFPDGLKISYVYAEEGQPVEEGDSLLAFDTDEIERAIESLVSDIHILNLRISTISGGVSASSSNAVLSAHWELDDAQEAYERLVARLDRDDMRSAEDYAGLEAALAKARSDYDKVVANTKTELIKTAEDAAQQAEDDLETAKESAEDAIRSAEQAVDLAAESLNSSQNTYNQAVSSYNQASNKLSQAQQLVSDLEIAAAAGEDNADELAAAREALQGAQANYDAAESNLNSQSVYGTASYDSAIQNLKATKERWEMNIQKAETALYDARAELTKVRQRTDFTDESAVISAQSVVDSAENALKNAKRGLEDSEYSREEQLYDAEKAIETARRNLESAEESAKAQALADSKNNAIAQTEAQIERLTYQAQLSEKETLRDSLSSALDNGGVVTAPVSGTVLKAMQKGERTTADTDAIKLSRNDEAFIFEGSLDRITSEFIAAGDAAQLIYTHEGQEHKLDVEIASISTPDSAGMVTITVNLPDGSYRTGQSGALSITKESDTDYSCLPLSALRSDNSGDYVLVLREQRTVMGTEHRAVRVDITVKNRDSELMSVESTLSYTDKVVISSNKPISEGDRVRIEGK